MWVSGFSPKISFWFSFYSSADDKLSFSNCPVIDDRGLILSPLAPENPKKIFSRKADRALERNITERVNERIQQYSTTVEIQLKRLRCKKFFHYCICNTEKKSTRSIGWRRRTRPAQMSKRNRASNYRVCAYTRYRKQRLKQKRNFEFLLCLAGSSGVGSTSERNFFLYAEDKHDRASEMCVEIWRNGLALVLVDFLEASLRSFDEILSTKIIFKLHKLWINFEITKILNLIKKETIF